MIRSPALRKVWLAVAVVVAVATLLVFQIVSLVRSLVSTPATIAASAPRPPAPDLDAAAPRAATYSNIYKYDYVGAETCEKCHTQNYDAWRGHPHSRMNRNATATTVVGNFSGGRLDYAGASVVFSKGFGEYTMTLYRDDEFVRQWKVTRTVGSRFVQMYIGVQSKGPEAPNDPVYTEEVKLPFAYSIERSEWFPQTYTVPGLYPEYDANGKLSPAYDILSKPGISWKTLCTKCHNTYPYVSRLLLVPNNRLAGFPANDVKLKSSVAASFGNLESWELVQMGISCESCHFGGREHALEGASISFVPRSQDLDLSGAGTAQITGSERNNFVINAICAQCHSAEPPAAFANGASVFNSGEASDLALSKCASKAACSTCHNPHRAGPTSAGVADAPRHIEACVGCHAKYRGNEERVAHVGHGSETKITCLDCHMPRIVHGLSSLVRTHDISSPADPRMLRDGQPNACNLCHLDKSVAWTVSALEAKWHAKPAIDVAPRNEPAGERWLAQKEAPIRAIAIDAYARGPNARGALPFAIGALEDPSPANRLLAVGAVERIVGRRISAAEYTPWAPANVRHDQAAALRKTP